MSRLASGHHPVDRRPLVLYPVPCALCVHALEPQRLTLFSIEMNFVKSSANNHKDALQVNSATI